MLFSSQKFYLMFISLVFSSHFYFLCCPFNSAVIWMLFAHFFLQAVYSVGGDNWWKALTGDKSYFRFTVDWDHQTVFYYLQLMNFTLKRHWEQRTCSSGSMTRPQQHQKNVQSNKRTDHTDKFIQSTVILYFFAFYNSRLWH